MFLAPFPKIFKNPWGSEPPLALIESKHLYANIDVLRELYPLGFPVGMRCTTLEPPTFFCGGVIQNIIHQTGDSENASEPRNSQVSTPFQSQNDSETLLDLVDIPREPNESSPPIETDQIFSNNEQVYNDNSTQLKAPLPVTSESSQKVVKAKKRIVSKSRRIHDSVKSKSPGEVSKPKNGKTSKSEGLKGIGKSTKNKICPYCNSTTSAQWRRLKKGSFIGKYACNGCALRENRKLEVSKESEIASKSLSALNAEVKRCASCEITETYQWGHFKKGTLAGQWACNRCGLDELEKIKKGIIE